MSSKIIKESEVETIFKQEINKIINEIMILTKN